MDELSFLTGQLRRTAVHGLLVIPVVLGLVSSTLGVAAASHKPRLVLTVPATAQAGTNVTFNVQSHPRTMITLRTRFSSQSSSQSRRTGAHGRAAFSYITPVTSQPGTVQITARAVVAERHLSTVRSMHVDPFVPLVGISNLQVLKQSGETWAPITEPHRGDLLRLTASYGVTEPAGSFFPPCVTGTLQIRQAGAPALSVQVQCPAAQPLNSLPYVYADFTVPNTFTAGEVTAELDLSYDEGQYGVARGSATSTFAIVGR